MPGAACWRGYPSFDAGVSINDGGTVTFTAIAAPAATWRRVASPPSTVLDPRTGPQQIGTAVGTYLVYEGWPNQQRVSDLDVRPGLSG